MSEQLQDKHTMHVVSHTHWDREWRYPFQQFRIMLVDMFDHLLEMMAEHPDYKCFHLDGHTVLIEDYLEVKPEKRSQLEQLIRDGRIVCGPWYVLPDPCVCSGESLVRNLQMGMEMTRELGGKLVSGYSPFGFGQVSQTPQIYNGFGLDNIFFYRGNNKHETKSEFIWEGPDGSRLLGFRLAEVYARGNFWANVYRPAVFNKWPGDWSYRWSEGQLPYHQCDSESFMRYDYYLMENADADTYYPENLPKALETIRNQALRDATTHQLLYCEGHDQSEAHPRITQIIEDANKLGADEFIHTSFAEYVEAVRAEAKDLQVKHGEFRYPNIDGLWLYLYYGTLASRMYLKQNNRAAENSLHGICEPLCTTAWMLGQEYPSGLLSVAWKHMLVNQAHDSIAGCSVDKVHEDCEYRTRQTLEIADCLAMTALGNTIKNIDASPLDADAICLVVYNPLAHERDEVVYAAVDVPAELESQSIRITDADGNEMPLDVLSVEKAEPVVKLPRDIPSLLTARRYHVRFQTGSVPGMGYKTFQVHADKTKRRIAGSLLTGPLSMANEHLAVTINADGTLDLTDKHTRRTYAGMGYFCDHSDVGDPWSLAQADRDETITTIGAPARIACVEDGPLCAKFRIAVTMTIPQRAMPDKSCRSAETVDIELVTIVTLKAGSRRLEFETHFTNTARDHRLRVMFPTDLKTDVSWAESEFDVVSRPIATPDDSTWRERAPRVHPQLGFCDLTDGKAGLAILNRGLTEYEAVDDERRTLAITLLRTHRFPVIGADPDETYEHPIQNGGQCLREHKMQYALCPHAGDWDAGDVRPKGGDFNIPLRVAQCGRPTGKLPMTAGIIEVASRKIGVSCLKKAQDRDSVVLRLYNPTGKDVTTTVSSLVPIREVHRITLDEHRIEALKVGKDGRIDVSLAAKAIVTLELVSGA